MLPVAGPCGLIKIVYVPAAGIVNVLMEPVPVPKFCGAIRSNGVVLHHSVSTCGTQWSTIRMPFTHRRAPSSVDVQSVYCSEYCALTWPVHRALQFSMGTEPPGLLPFKVKSTTESVRVSVGLPESVVLL